MTLDPNLRAAHEKLTQQVMGRPGIAGTAVGERRGKPCLLVYLKARNAGKGLPRSVGGFPVVKEVTGDVRAR
jgi:hypothetical protein